jgi:hypothetical protein
MEYLTSYWAVSLHFCCNDIYFPKEYHKKTTKIGAVGGEMLQSGFGK